MLRRMVLSDCSCWMWVVGRAQGGQMGLWWLGRHWVTSMSSHLFFGGGVCAVHVVLCSLEDGLPPNPSPGWITT